MAKSNSTPPPYTETLILQIQRTLRVAAPKVIPHLQPLMFY